MVNNLLKDEVELLKSLEGQDTLQATIIRGLIERLAQARHYKVYTCTQFSGHYPVGTCAVVVMANAEFAAAHLQRELEKHGLGQNVTPDMMELVDTTKSSVNILLDGNY